MLCILLAAGLADDLDTVLRHHRTTREMIQTLSCRYRMVLDGSLNDEGEYLRVGDVVWYENRPSALPIVWQQLRKNGESFTITTPHRAPQAVRHVDKNDHFVGDVLTHSLYRVRVDLRRTAFLEEAAAAAIAKECKRVGEQYEIRLQLPERKLTLWLSPAHNYACVKVSDIFSASPGTVTEATYEVVSFTESGSIFFPTKVQIEFRQNGKLGRPSQWEFFDVVLNAPIAAERLRIRYPKDTVMADYISGTVYYVDEDGNKLRDHEKLQIVKEDWRNPIAGAVRSQTQVEAGGPWWYAVGAFGGMLIVVLVLWYGQRRRQRAVEEAA